LQALRRSVVKVNDKPINQEEGAST